MAAPLAEGISAWGLETRILEIITALDELPPEQEMPDGFGQELADALDAAADRRDALAGAYLRREAHVNALRERAKNALDKAERSERALVRFRAYILSLLDLRGVKQLQGTQYSIRWQQNPPHVEIDTMVFDDGRFMYVPEVSPIPDKKAIRQHLDSGGTIEGARLVEGDRRVVIR